MKGFCLDEMGKVSLNNWDEEENKAGRGSKTLTSKSSKHNKSSMQGQAEDSFPNIEVMGAEMINVKAITASCFGTS